MVRTAQLENDVFLLVFVVCLFPFGETDATLDLTPQPPYCPGPVIFTCVGTEITSSLFWIVNGSEVAAYGYSSRVDLPVDLDIDPPLDGVTAVVTEVDRITNTLFNITSIFNVSDVTVLNGASLQCGDSNNASHPLIISMNIPPPANRLLHLPGSLKISLQWSPSFTSQYTAVDKYRVSVNPDPSSCSSDQVSPSEDYSCSGLVLGTRYTFTVSAINCGDQEGERESFTVNIAMKVLGIPTIIAVTREGNQIRVEWQKVLFPLDTNKTLNIDTNYSVVISDSEGNELYQTDVNSDVCNNEGLCTTSFIPDDYSLEQYNMITVTVRASNVFGESNSTEISVTCVRLTNINTVLLSLGVVLSCIALLGCVILIFLRIKNGYSMWVLILVIVGCVVLVISIVLWVAVAGLQDNTCDSDWQFSRDGLIISAFVLSATAMVVIVATLLVAVWAFKKKRKDKYEAETVETPGPVFSLEDTSQNNAEEENEAQQEKSQALKVKFGAIKPAFEPDDLHECQDCGHKLYGFWWPGYEHHHCYACGKLVCAPCSKYKAYLEYCTKECRVCENCFKEYSEQQQPAQDTKLKDSSPVPDQENSPQRVQETPFDGNTHIQNPQGLGAQGSEDKQSNQKECKGRSSLSEGDQATPIEEVKPDTKVVKTCHVCGKESGGFLKKKTECQSCGKVVCTKCYTQEAFVPDMNKTSKVCDSCYKQFGPIVLDSSVTPLLGEEGSGSEQVVSADKVADSSSIKTSPAHVSPSSQPELMGEKDSQRKKKAKEGCSSLSEGDQSTNIGEVDPEREELKDVETCRVCLKGFDWPLKHNTVCQACGKVVCTGCCTQEAFVPYMKKRHKVCNSCYEHLKLKDKQDDTGATNKSDDDHPSNVTHAGTHDDNSSSKTNNVTTNKDTRGTSH